LEELRQNVSSKIDSLATAEKNAYKKMDSIEEKCKKMKLEVKTKTDEQVLSRNTNGYQLSNPIQQLYNSY